MEGDSNKSDAVDDVGDVVMKEEQEEEIDVVISSDPRMLSFVDAVWDHNKEEERKNILEKIQEIISRKDLSMAERIGGAKFNLPGMSGVVKNREDIYKAIESYFYPKKREPERVGEITLGLDRGFIGKHDLNCLLKKIEETFSWYTEKNYLKYQSPSFPIIQSSGMGKTKLMIECRDKLKESEKYSSLLLLCVFDKGVPPKCWENSYDGILWVPSGDGEVDRRQLVDQIVLLMTGNCDHYVLFFDEAQNLLHEHHGFAFSCIKWWMRQEGGRRKVVAVFAGTNTSLGKLYMGVRPKPANSRDPKITFYNWKEDDETEKEKTLKLFPPFLDLTTISCYKDMKFTKDQTTDLERSLFYGRPLFPVMMTENPPNLKIDSGDWDVSTKTLANSTLYAILKRMMLSNNGTDWGDNPMSKMSILATRVQMGMSTSAEFIESVTAKGYANLVGHNIDEGDGQLSWITSRLVFMPDPLCATLAMCMMRKEWKLSTKGNELKVFEGKAPAFWSKEAALSFQRRLFLPEKGDAGEIMAALHMLFCGDELREAKNASMWIFQVSFRDWLDRMHEKQDFHPAAERSSKYPRRTEAAMNTVKRQRSDPSHATNVPNAAGSTLVPSDVRATLSFIQVCRNYFRSHSWFTQIGLEYMYCAAIGAYSYVNCPAFDIVIPIKIISGDSVRYHPLLVSVKCREEMCTQEMKDAIESMKGYLDSFRRNDEAKAYCLLVVVGSIKTSPPPPALGGPLPENDVFDCVVLSNGADKYNVSEEMKGVAKLSVITEMRASHYMAYTEEREFAFRASMTDKELEYAKELFHDKQQSTESSVCQ